MTTVVALKTTWRLDLLMRDRGVTNEDVARKTGVSARTVARWRQAKTIPSTINVITFDVLLEMLQCTREELWVKEVNSGL